MTVAKPKIAVVIPCYKVKDHILDVIRGIGPEVSRIYVVDDACPHGSGDFVKKNGRDARVEIIRHDQNQGVGGAVMTGYMWAIKEGMDIIVKVDGDGQMDPALIPAFVSPIISNEADYTKGNRFFDPDAVRSMPPIRIFGNAVLSFMNKLSSGYWNIFDPTNGYTAIHVDVARHLPFSKISRRYFFESDVLFRLNTLRAVVVDVPIEARYADEVSNLRITNIIGEFFWKHIKNFMRRLFYNYYLRDMSIASIELPTGLALLSFGLVFGSYHWYLSASSKVVTTSGTVMLSALPVLMGIQFVLAFLSHDVSSTPRRPIGKRLKTNTSLQIATSRGICK